MITSADASRLSAITRPAGSLSGDFSRAARTVPTPTPKSYTTSPSSYRASPTVTYGNSNNLSPSYPSRSSYTSAHGAGSLATSGTIRTTRSSAFLPNYATPNTAVTRVSYGGTFGNGAARPMPPGVVKQAPKTHNPDFIVSSRGVAYPIPTKATGPVNVTNQSGKVTGKAFVGGKGGVNGQVSTVRIMDPVPARGNSPAYPRGYIKYENSMKPKPQGVEPYTGKTIPNSKSHHPL